ncbi:putative lipid II flippase FtsW [Endozoicomonadaceae bacterium StTr2]
MVSLQNIFRRFSDFRPTWGQPLKNDAELDFWLLGVTLAVLSLGLVMVASASTEIGSTPLYYAIRQAIYVAAGLVALIVVMTIELQEWQRFSTVSLLVSIALLVIVLFMGREINGSVRWINLGFFNLQASEVAKLGMVVYIAAYLVRRRDEVRSQWWGFIKPMLVLGGAAALLLAEPDFGAVVVLLVAVLGMIFLAGVPLMQYLVLMVVCVVGVIGILLTQAYRIERLKTYLDPWADQFGSGYQLTQSLIAFGKGEWLGQGLGNSIQKLFYLPEAHTDFVLAVLAEELGLIGSLVLLAMLMFISLRALSIGHLAERAGQFFAAYVAYGISFLIGGQVVVNIGVNIGLLPTKGLTLPFVSYGGSSMVMNCLAIGLLLRIDYERRCLMKQKQRREASND